MLHSAITFYIGPLPSLVEEFSVTSASQMRQLINQRLLAAGIDDKNVVCVVHWLFSTCSRTSHLMPPCIFSPHPQSIRLLQHFFPQHAQPKSDPSNIGSSHVFMVCSCWQPAAVFCFAFIHFLIDARLQVPAAAHCDAHLSFVSGGQPNIKPVQ